MNIQLNGQSKKITPGITLTSLIQNLQINENNVVVELNRSIIQPGEFPATKIKENDQVEIIRFVGGG